MYNFGTTNNDIYEQGVDEGRRQVLADLARIIKDSVHPEEIADNVYDYLEQEGYL